MTVEPERTARLLLDQQLPVYEARQFTAVVVDAPPDQTYAAVRALDPDRVARSFPLMVVLGQLRALPARFASSPLPRRRRCPRTRRPMPSSCSTRSRAGSTSSAWSASS